MENVEQVEQVEEVEEVSKTFTEEEVQKLIQAESDKRVNQALEKKQADWKKQYETNLEEEKRKAAMSEEDKWKDELKKQMDSFNAEKEEFKKVQLKALTLENLAKEALPATIANFVIGSDEEATLANIASLKEAWTDALQKEVNERLKGNTPRTSSKGIAGQSDITKEDFKKMGYKERIKLQESNPELFSLLSK